MLKYKGGVKTKKKWNKEKKVKLTGMLILADKKAPS